MHYRRFSRFVNDKGVTALFRYGLEFWEIHLISLLSPLIQRGFHLLYYYSGKQTWGNTCWMSIPAWKCPLDLFIYQEIIFQTRPEVIIDTGTNYGGSSLFFSHMCELLGTGEVITIDLMDKTNVNHPRLTKVVGNSISGVVVDSVRSRVRCRSCMVVLDSDHSMQHVSAELNIYSQFVGVGNYLIVEDTNMNGHPVERAYGPGPREAVNEFLRCHPNFVRDPSWEKHLLTFNPSGFLKRVCLH